MTGSAPRPHFADHVILRLRRLGHPLCVGIDPHLERLPAHVRRGTMRPQDPATADAVEHFGRAIVDRVADRVAVIKPQIAFFEQLGWRGLRALTRIVGHAHDAGLLVLLDAKRGDIGSTAAGYARAYLDAGAALPVDAITLNPYLGNDTLGPFLNAASGAGRGIFVLVRTSNPGARDLQNRVVDEAPLYATVATSLAASAEALTGPETGWSSLGVVVGATAPGESEQVRERLPHSLFLVPGYGAQGGSAADAVRGFVPGPGGVREGGLVNSSRGILFPEGSDTDDTARWQRTIDDALSRAIDELGEAVRG